MTSNFASSTQLIILLGHRAGDVFGGFKGRQGNVQFFQKRNDDYSHKYYLHNQWSELFSSLVVL